MEGLERRLFLSAYSASTVAAFGVNTTGSQPFGGVTMDAQGNVYGLTQYGGANGFGTLYELPSGSAAVQQLASFNSNPEDPRGTAWVADAPVIDASGDIFGVAGQSIFELPHGSSTIQTVATIPNVFPGLTIDSSGNLFGVTSGADVNGNGDGTIFEISHGSTSITNLAELPFTGIPVAMPPVLDASGDLFGVVGNYANGSTNGYVYELPHGSSSPQIIWVPQFNNAPDPALAVDGSGNVYGSNIGTFFELAAGTHTFKSLGYPPATSGGYGRATWLALDGSDNVYESLFGGLPGWSNNKGDIAEYSVATSTVSWLGHFPNQGGPYGAIAVGSTGNVFAAMSYGGTEYNGDVVEIPHGATSPSVLASFADTNGSSPNGLMMDGGGNLFGTTLGGDGHGDGTVFEVKAGQTTPTTLDVFHAATGPWSPQGPFVMDSAGNLFGAEAGGGANGDGALFEIPHGSSTLTQIASFNGTNGAYPSNLVADGSGNFYGITGTSSSGAPLFFEVPHGTTTITTLASLNAAGSDYQPSIDSAGDLFVTSSNGGSNGQGVIYELPHGSTTAVTVATFGAGTGTNPGAMVVVDSSGNVFGTCQNGGANNDGTIFEVAHGSSTVTTIAAFNGTNGRLPYGPLLMDSSGDLFGTTSYGGRGASLLGGTVFEIVHGTSVITTLAAFDDRVGADLQGPLIFGPGGAIYGTTSTSGPGNGGSIFKLTPVQTSETINGTGGAGAISLSIDSGGMLMDWTAGASSGYFALGDPNGLTIIGDSTNDAINIDPAYWPTTPAQLIHLNGTFTINGANRKDVLYGTDWDVRRASTLYLTYDSTTPGPLASVQSALRASSQAGWNTTPGSGGSVTSSDVALNPTQLAVGYADSADANSPDKIANTIELKTTFVGDTNLDGSVNLSDLLTLTRNFGKGTNWDQGDFNYDSFVNLADFTALSRNFGKTLVVNPLIVTSTADDGSLGTLRYAIAHSNAGDIITFDPGVFAPGTAHTLTLNGTQLELAHNLTIQGPGSANLSISGNNASRVFLIDPSVTATISGLTLTHGNAGSSYGGAIEDNAGTLVLSNCVLQNNTGSYSGAIYLTHGSAQVSNCTFSYNTAANFDGAVGCDTGTIASFTGCTFNNNTATNGGAMLGYDTSLTLINDTFTANSATAGPGGAIDNLAGTCTISNCTIVGNSSTSAGAGVYAGTSVLINNSIIAQNTVNGSPSDLAGSALSTASAYNLVGDGSGGLSTSNHNLLGSTSSLLNPKLGPLSNNGGPTPTMLPQAGSPVIDAGSNSLIPTGMGTDQRGYARIFNGTVDIGAVEAGASASTAALVNSTASVPMAARRRA